ncbi:unnamed protein product, partial [Protopolystoma xenopodis]
MTESTTDSILICRTGELASGETRLLEPNEQPPTTWKFSTSGSLGLYSSSGQKVHHTDNKYDVFRDIGGHELGFKAVGEVDGDGDLVKQTGYVLVRDNTRFIWTLTEAESEFVYSVNPTVFRISKSNVLS